MSENQRVYKTKQYTLVLEYLQKHQGEHITVDRIADELRADGHQIGRTTVYRQLEKMSVQGITARYNVPGMQSACYQYISGCGEHEHYHLKCSECGALLHCECEYLDGISAHVRASHSFVIDPAATVLYGVCSQCSKEAER